MTKKILTLMAFVMLTISSVFAGGKDISKSALTTFSGSFAKATNVKWEKYEDYYKASFQMNGQSLNAFVSEQGDIIAVSRNILSTGLPIGLQASLGKDFATYWITDLTEYAVGNETKYYITVENADGKITMENVGTYDWSVTRKSAK